MQNTHIGGIYKVHMLLFLALLIRPTLASVVSLCFAQPLVSISIICIISSKDVIVKITKKVLNKNVFL